MCGLPPTPLDVRRRAAAERRPHTGAVKYNSRYWSIYIGIPNYIAIAYIVAIIPNLLLPPEGTMLTLEAASGYAAPWQLNFLAIRPGLLLHQAMLVAILVNPVDTGGAPFPSCWLTGGNWSCGSCWPGAPVLPSWVACTSRAWSSGSRLVVSRLRRAHSVLRTIPSKRKRPASSIDDIAWSCELR